MKGYLGFGDRLETLKMCVAYAITNNLQLYVDWRDPLWSHGSENFYTYFDIVNMPVLKSLSDIPSDATYHPALWKGRMEESISADFYEEHKNSGLDLGLIQGKVYDADVIVVSNVGLRMLYTDSTFFANVFRLVDPRIIEKVKYHKSRYPLEKSWGIHIRGTDHVHKRKRDLSVQSIVSNITIHGGLNQPNMIAVSDDVDNLQLWLRYYPQTYVVSNPKPQTSLKGSHTLSPEEMLRSKDEGNIESLVDFFVLASCSRIFSTVRGSRFTAEAQRLHPFVNIMLNV